MERHQGRAVKVDPSLSPVDRAWFQRLKLKYDVALSNSASYCNLRRYIKSFVDRFMAIQYPNDAAVAADPELADYRAAFAELLKCPEAGWCKPKPVSRGWNVKLGPTGNALKGPKSRIWSYRISHAFDDAILTVFIHIQVYGRVFPPPAFWTN